MFIKVEILFIFKCHVHRVFLHLEISHNCIKIRGVTTVILVKFMINQEMRVKIARCLS